MKKRSPKQLYEAKLQAESDLDAAVCFLLEHFGWVYTCEIGSIWLWMKEIDGCKVAVNESTALILVEVDLEDDHG